jgi:hypothetical protein
MVVVRRSIVARIASRRSFSRYSFFSLVAVVALFSGAHLPRAGAVDVVVPSPSAWQYFDQLNRGQPYPDVGLQRWYSPNYDPAAPSYGQWQTGPSPFAQGGIDAFVGRSPTALAGTPAQRTTYLFRRTLELEHFHTAATSGTVSAICDDGCIGYLNGVELFRMNMPAGIATPDALATAVGSETTYTTTTVSLLPGRLRVGANTLAVEVHNNATTSSDLGFDMTFSLDVFPPPVDVPHPLGLSAISAKHDPAIGIGANYRFFNRNGGSGFHGVAINAHGQTAFHGRINGPNLNDGNDSGIWIGRRNDLQLVVRSGTATPGLPGKNFYYFGNPWINNAGEVAFYANVVEGTSPFGTDSIWSTVGGALRVVAAIGQQAPGTSPGVHFAPFPTNRLTEFRFNDGGHIAFRATLAGPGVDGNNENGAWVERNGVLELAARRSSPVPPGLPAGTIWNSIAMPVLNDHGDYIIAGQVIGAAPNFTRSSAAWLRTGGQTQLFWRTGEPAPGFPSGWRFSDVGFGYLDNQGRAFLRGNATNNDVNHVSGIWFGTRGSLQRLVYDEMPAPGLPQGALLVGIFSGAGPHYNEEGELVFAGGLRQNAALGITSANDTVVWAYRDGGVTAVAREGDPVPGMPVGTRFSNFSPEQPLINNFGQVAFFAELTAADNSALGTGAFAEDREGYLHLLAFEGDTFFTGPGQSHVISSIVPPSRYTDLDMDGFRPAWNDNGQLTFLVGFDHGNEGAMLVSNLLFVPEPGGILPIALAVAGCLWRWRRSAPGNVPLST